MTVPTYDDQLVYRQRTRHPSRSICRTRCPFKVTLQIARYHPFIPSLQQHPQHKGSPISIKHVHNIVVFECIVPSSIPELVLIVGGTLSSQLSMTSLPLSRHHFHPNNSPKSKQTNIHFLIHLRQQYSSIPSSEEREKNPFSAARTYFLVSNVTSILSESQARTSLVTASHGFRRSQGQSWRAYLSTRASTSLFVPEGGRHQGKVETRPTELGVFDRHSGLHFL